MRNLYKMSARKYNGKRKRPLGRLNHRWENNIMTGFK
jgi:hypothetical protein